jgi:cyclase
MRMFRHNTTLNLAGLAGLVILFGLGGAGSLAQAQQNATGSDALEVLPLRPNFYMIAGAGANIGVQFGEDGIVLVDTGSGPASDRVLAEIKKLTDKPIRYIINTSADPDHVGGNEALSKAGKSLFIIPGAGGNAATLATSLSSGAGATILAHDNVEVRMNVPAGEKSVYSRGAHPTITYPSGTSSQAKGWQKYLNGEGIEVFYQPAAHTDGDSTVFFRRSDVVVAGDVFNTETFPVIDVARGGSIQGEIDALNRIIDITIPELPLTWQEGGTLVIPGHGRICDQADVVEYRDMVTIIRDVIQSLISKGDTLEQIKAADPTFEYRARYGSDSGPWTTDMFVEAVYRSLVGKDRQKTNDAKN